MKSITLDYLPEAVAALQPTMLAAFAEGTDQVVLDLDRVAVLDAEGVRGLITLLRRSREVGGVVALRTGRADITRSLSVLGLDRIFPMERAA